MRLYHFSDNDVKSLKASYFGKNSFTKNDAKIKVNRLFFYDTPKPKEYNFLTSNFRYTVTIDKEKLYNLDKDNDGLKGKHSFDIDGILKEIKQNFDGCYYTTSFLTLILFKEQKTFNKETRKEGKKWKTYF